MEDPIHDVHAALSGVTAALKDIGTEAKRRILKAAAAFYGLSWAATNGESGSPRDSTGHGSAVSHNANAEGEPIFSGHHLCF
jgi:hypothetical protein